MKNENKKKKQNYIDNAVMYEELKKYKTLYRKAKKENLPLPKVSAYLGECFLLIAKNLASSHKFNGYPFREEMEGDAVENSLLYLHNFDEKNYTNPLAYFTQISWYAFLRRIYKEKKQLYTKHKIAENTMLFAPEYEGNDSQDNIDVDSNIFNETFVDNVKMNEIIKGFENNLTKKKDKRKKTLSTLIDD